MSEFLNPIQVALYEHFSITADWLLSTGYWVDAEDWNDSGAWRDNARSHAAVFDDPPGQADGLPYESMPFIVIGDDTVIPWDTDDTLGASTTITLHVWSRYNGRKEANTILGEIYRDLHRNAAGLTLAGYHIVDCLHEFSTVFKEIDGVTRHGVCRYRITIQKE